MPSRNNEPVSSLLRKHYPALDSLRGLAVLLVFLCHYGRQLPTERITYWGWIGVDIFFVLSGFLITGILYDSLGEHHFFRNFYIRRTLRIFPLYYSFWIAIVLLTPILLISWNKYVALHALYIGNFYTTPLTSFLSFRHNHILVLGHFWSLDIEEQFYLAWPLLVFLLRGRRKLMRFCAIAIPFVLCLRIAVFFLYPSLAHNTNLLYNATCFRCDALLMGAWAALWLRGSTLSIATLRKRTTTIALTAVVLLITSQAICLTLYPQYRTPTDNLPWLETYGYTLIDAAAVCLLLTCLQPATSLYRILCALPLEKLGRVSYGFYILHNLPFNAFYAHQPWLAAHHLQVVAAIVLFFLCYAAAKISFRFLESPFLRLKSRLAPTSADPTPYPPPF